MSKRAQSHIEFCVEKHMLCTCGAKTHTVENPACAATYRRLAVAACMEATNSIRDHAAALQVSDTLLHLAHGAQSLAESNESAAIQFNASLCKLIREHVRCKRKKPCGKCGLCKLIAKAEPQFLDPYATE